MGAMEAMGAIGGKGAMAAMGAIGAMGAMGAMETMGAMGAMKAMGGMSISVKTLNECGFFEQYVVKTIRKRNFGVSFPFVLLTAAPQLR